MLEWTAQQLELLPLDSVATRPEWVKLPGQSCAVWELHNGGQWTGWTLDDSRRIFTALYPWHLVHQDGRTIKPNYAMGWQHSKEAKAAALRVYSGELQLVPASMLPWKTKGRALTDSGHAIRDIYILMEV